MCTTEKYKYLHLTAHKRSLGQGNMFTGVCLSTGGVPAPGGACLGGLVQGGSGPGGGACSGVGLVLGGVPAPRVCLVETPRQLLLRTVRILLECILVKKVRTHLGKKSMLFMKLNWY